MKQWQVDAVVGEDVDLDSIEVEWDTGEGVLYIVDEDGQDHAFYFQFAKDNGHKPEPSVNYKGKDPSVSITTRMDDAVVDVLEEYLSKKYKDYLYELINEGGY